MTVSRKLVEVGRYRRSWEAVKAIHDQTCPKAAS